MLRDVRGACIVTPFCHRISVLIRPDGARLYSPKGVIAYLHGDFAAWMARRAVSRSLAPVDRVFAAIHVIRGQRVMLDADLAALYGVSTKQLNEQVRRNRDRFPADFMVQLTTSEAANLRSQTATSRSGHGGRRFRPHAFTEHGAVMLASVLNTPVAVAASLQVVRAFIRLRGLLAAHEDLARKLEELEKKYDARFAAVFRAIKELMTPPPPPRKRIGFVATRSGGAVQARVGVDASVDHGEV